MVLVVDIRSPRLESERDVEHLRSFVEHAGITLHHLGVGVGAVEEQVAFFLGVDEWRIFPVAVNVQILVVEPCRWVVPLSDLDRTRFVGHVDDVKPVGPTVGVIVLGDGVEVAVG